MLWYVHEIYAFLTKFHCLPCNHILIIHLADLFQPFQNNLTKAKLVFKKLEYVA
jgi:hypothetical protein